MISGNTTQPGALFTQVAEGVSPEYSADANEANANKASHSLAFAGLFVFTLLLYARPQELFPQLFTDVPFVKVIAIATLIAYTVGKLKAGESFTIWPIEMKMLALIVLLGVAFVPIAVSPSHSIDLLTDSFFKVILIFVLMVNLIDTKGRLHSIMKLVVMCGVLVALVTIKNYFAGNLDISHVANDPLDISHVAKALPALTTPAGTHFDNTNELALTLDLLLPIAVVLAVTGKGLVRFAYAGCAAIIGTGAVITFSRGGFLGLVSIGGMLMWKLGRGKRLTMALATLLLVGAFAVAMPSGYSERLFTILHPAEDKTNSAQERQVLLGRAVELALKHPVIGIGIANFEMYSFNGKVAHNSYLEIAAELGWTGLVVYLIFLISPFRWLKRIERGTLAPGGFVKPGAAGRRELYYLSVGLQAMMFAFTVGSFFSSSQYSWHPYYIAGFSIALRRIYTAQLSTKQTSAREEAPLTLTSGTLWKTIVQRRGAA